LRPLERVIDPLHNHRSNNYPHSRSQTHPGTSKAHERDAGESDHAADHGHRRDPLMEENPRGAAVARELHVTASGVSMQLAALEREIGVPVTERQGRGVVLTPAGVLLAQHGREILDRLSLAEFEVGALRRGAVGRYAIAAFPSAARTFVAQVWRELLGEASGLEVRITTLEPEDALAALSSGGADIAVVHSYSNVPRDVAAGIHAHLIASDPVWLAVRSAHASDEGRSVSLADYAERSWIVPSSELTCHTMVERACGLAGFRPRVVAESTDFATQLALVPAGAGVALVPDLAVEAVPEGVVLHPLADPVSRSVFLAARTSARNDPGIQQLCARLGASAQSSVQARRMSLRR